MERILPFHPKPKPEEILSSWLIRTASGNGLELPSIARFGGSNVDIDANPSDELLVRAARITGTTLKHARETAMSSYEGIVFEARSVPALPAWVLPLGRISGDRLQHGVQCCTLCLRESPYFKKIWRLAFRVACVRHETMLVDRCSECKSPIDFRQYIRSGRFALQSLMKCGACGALHVTKRADDVILESQAWFVSAMAQGFAMIGNEKVHVLLFLKGVRSMVRALTTGPRSEALRGSIRNRLPVDVPSLSLRAGERFEFLDVELRTAILRLLIPMLHNWPSDFVGYCRSGRIRVCDLLHRFVSITDLPFWYARVVAGMLKPRYAMNALEVSSVTRYVALNGNDPFRTLCDLFGNADGIRERRELFTRVKELGWWPGGAAIEGS